MRIRETVDRSIEIITEYYEGNLQPYFDAIADDVLWIGPRGGQVLQGKEAIINAWEAAEHDLTFSMGSIEAMTARPGLSDLEVLLEYYVHTYFPDGASDRHHQRLHLSWGYRGRDEEGNRIPKICMIHISNVTEEQEPEGSEDQESEEGAGVKVYASSPSESRIDAVRLPSISSLRLKTLYAKGKDEVIYYFNAASVMWIESTDRSHHCIIHTLDGSCKSIEKLRNLQERYPDVFLRSHASYLVNPLYVRSLRRFKVTMADGRELPVPQKKYSAFKRALGNWDGGRA